MSVELPERAVGLGLRRVLLEQTLALPHGEIDFVECAPENWMHMGGRYAAALNRVREKYPLTCHGLSLSLGGITPFDLSYLHSLRDFLVDVTLYSEHLSYCSDDAQLYDLLPIPFTSEAVTHVAARIREVQDFLGRRIAIENVSYYTPHPVENGLSEPDFICAVISEADCDLLLDVNNLYVNAVNHGTDPQELIQRVPSSRVASFHIAGHYDESDSLKIDSHGAPVKEDVWSLLHAAYQTIGHRPTLLERDFNFGDFAGLRSELARIRNLQNA